ASTPLLDGISALLARTRAPSIRQNLVCNAGMLLAVFANERDIGNVDRRFLLDDAALDVFLRIRAGVPLDHLDTFDHKLLVLGNHDQDAAGLAAILSTQNENFIILLDWRHCRHL